MADLRPETGGCKAEPREGQPALEVRGLTVRTAERVLLRDVELSVPRSTVFGVIGPSGAGKSTLLRCLNRLVDLTPQLDVSGEVLLDGRSVRDPGMHPDALRARVGMLFQRPVVFPGSIRHNVVFGARRTLGLPRRELPDIAERALREVALWDEVKDRLSAPADTLSAGQQQRLCLARTLATRPEVILMDEPTSSLDPRSTQAIEELILTLKRDRTIVLVTHDLDQARRVADWLGCVCLRDGAGELMESACCAELLENPSCQEVADFLRQPGA